MYWKIIARCGNQRIFYFMKPFSFNLSTANPYYLLNKYENNNIKPSYFICIYNRVIAYINTPLLENTFPKLKIGFQNERKVYLVIEIRKEENWTL